MNTNESVLRLFVCGVLGGMAIATATVNDPPATTQPAGSTPVLEFSGSNLNIGKVTTSSSAFGNLIFKTGNAGVAGTEWLRLQNNGFFGINTPSPQTPLEVNGIVRINRQVNSPTHYTSFRMHGPSYLTNGLEIAFYGGDAYTGNSHGAGVGGVSMVNLNNGPIVFGTNNTAQMKVNADGKISMGNITPVEKLDVLGGIRVTDGTAGTLSLYGDPDGAKLTVGRLQAGTRDFRVVDATNGETFRVTSDGFLGIGGQGFAYWNKTSKTISLGDVMGGDDARAGGVAENLTFRTKDRDVASFNSQGWFSLGNPTNPAVTNTIPAPQAELHIRDSYTDADNRADLYLSGSTGGGGVLRFYEADIERATIRSDDPANVGGFNIQTGGTSTNGPGTQVTIKANGDVKTTGSLEVVGEGILSNLKTGPTSSGPGGPAGGYIGFKGLTGLPSSSYALAQFSNGGTAINAATGSSVVVGIGGGTLAYFNASGFTMNGEGAIGNFKTGATSTGPGGPAGMYVGYKGLSSLPSSSYALAQYSNGGTAINAAAGSNVVVGIGGGTLATFSAGGLTMAGASTITAGTIVATNWQISQAPDYVFEKDYRPAPLHEVESFVQKNKHLPEVPSAKQMKAEGLDLVKMNFLLLKKVEELTLHAIRQEKEMKRQAAEIHGLKSSYRK